MSHEKRNVLYIFDVQLYKECNRIPQFLGRASLVHNLILEYGLLSRMTLLESKPAKKEDLITFHSPQYIEFLQNVNDSTDGEENEDSVQFGLGYDCELIRAIYSFVKIIAGGTLTAAQCLVNETASIAVNWCGGWHHAQRDGAEGFCYINDIVIAIETLRKKFDRVLYIDLDVHHGNGVENAYAFTKKVMTLSFHNYEPGFYPTTGALTDIGFGRGKFYAVNVPLKSGIRDDLYVFLFESVVGKVWSVYQPSAVVVQCGADCITGDPIGTFNLTPKALGQCLEVVLSWGIPTLCLGGGGYNFANTARYWAFLTSVISQCPISTEIPDNLHFLKYGPGYELDIPCGQRVDNNTKEEIDEIIKTISDNLNTSLKTNSI